MERVLLQLTSSPEQQAALDQLLAEQQDPNSPQYHVWLTPEQFGEQFGASPEDIGRIAGWLELQGFQVTEVSPGRRSIEFSGTALQVEAAFHTQITKYEWNGREYTANATDISIPVALAPVVAGVVSLHNFGVRPLHHVISPNAAPLTDLTGGQHGLSPYDFAAIYDLTPLWTSGYDGTGQNIAIVGESDVAMSDVTGFRARFGLPVNNPTFIVNGPDPGFVAGDQTESTLDVEWAGAVAKGASIKFVTSAGTNTSDGITLSAQYIVQHSTAPVMSLSYGLCEEQLGSSNYFYGSLWQQAAAEGIAVFVANGDSGSAGCDAPYSAGNSGADTTLPASQGFGINGLASTPYNVAVGGSEFNDAASPSTYWNASNNAELASAKGYIPEMAWNESAYTASGSANSLYAGGGGVSMMWSRQSWQTGTGVPSGAMRLTPDVSLSAAGHDGYLIEQGGSLYLVGGTSASTPSFAGLMAIVNQYTHTTNGNPNSKFYALAASVPSVYHDVTTGSNAVPCEGGSPSCSTAAPSTNTGKMNGYSAGAGYDMATGLGSVDANALVTNWGGTAAAPSIVALIPNPMTGSAATQNLTINGAGFVAGSGLQVTVGAVTYQAPAVTFVTSAQVVVSVNVGISAQALPVKVSIPNGKVTNSVTLTVVAPAPAPVITTLIPNPMAGSNSIQTLTVNGSGFVAGGGLKVTVGTAIYQGTQVALVSSTQIAVSVNVGAAALSFPVQVTNPSGQTSNSAALTVTAAVPVPVVTSLNPDPMTGSSSAQTLTIGGIGFVAGNALKVTVGGTVYQASQIIAVSSSQITVSVNVGTPAASLSVQVINPGGQASNSATLTVTAPLVPPVIATLSPNPMTGSNSAQTLTINGTGFLPGLKLSIGGLLVTSTQLALLTPTELQVNLITPLSSHTYAMQVLNSSGEVSNIVNFQVNAPAIPAIASLTPNPLTHSAAPQVLTINGTNFQPGAGLTVNVGSTSYSGGQVTFVSASQLKVTVTVASASPALAVKVTDPSGAVSNSESLTVK